MTRILPLEAGDPVTRILPLEAGDVVIANVTTLAAARAVRYNLTNGKSLVLRDGKARWASKGGRWLVVIPA